MHKRIEWIDYAKAFGIILVVFAHLPYNYVWDGVKQAIYSFHMPLFFMFYGLSYHVKNVNLFSLLRKKIFRLLFPAFLWGIIYAPMTLKNILLIFYGSQRSFAVAQSLSSLWFLPCMFLAVIFFEILTKIQFFEKFVVKVILFVVTSLLGFFLSFFSCPAFGFPWSLNVLFMALSFIIFGNIIKGVFDNFEFTLPFVKKIVIQILFFLICSILLIFSYKKNLKYLNISNVDLASAQYCNYFLFMLDAICGSLMVLLFSKLISINRSWNFLSSIGKSSMGIFILHKPILLFFLQLFENEVSSTFIISASSFLISISVSYLLTLLMRKYFPELFGEKLIYDQKYTTADEEY